MRLNSPPKAVIKKLFDGNQVASCDFSLVAGLFKADPVYGAWTPRPEVCCVTELYYHVCLMRTGTRSRKRATLFLIVGSRFEGFKKWSTPWCASGAFTSFVPSVFGPRVRPCSSGFDL